MVSVKAVVLATLALVALGVASPANNPLSPRQSECQPVRDAISANQWPCSESSGCNFCCDEWLDLSVVFGAPCHGGHGDAQCPAGRREFHCGSH